MSKWKVSDVELSDFLSNLERNYPPKWYIRALASDLQDARKELEEAKKDSVWLDAPEDATFASVHHCVTSGQPYKPDVARFYHRTLPKTSKQELIDKFSEKNALAMKCANLSKEILEAFVKEYEEVMKPLDK